MKNNCCFFERLFKIKKNGVLLFGISFHSTDINVFLLCKLEKWWRHAHEMVQYWKYWGRVLQFGTRNVHYKRNKMTCTPVELLPWQQFCRWSCQNWKLKFPVFILTKKHLLQPLQWLELRHYDNPMACLFQASPSVSL